MTESSSGHRHLRNRCLGTDVLFLPQANLGSIGSGQIVEPCTVLSINETIPTTSDIEATLHRFGRSDDVWSKDFASCIIIQASLGKHDRAAIRSIKRILLRVSRVEKIHILKVQNLSEALPEGPYFLNHGRLHQAFRLYADKNGAFIVSTVPSDDHGTFQSLDCSAYGEQHPSALTIAVPSRLYYKPTKVKPYAGLRLAIKDNIDLKGLKTGASSRAYTSLYPPRKHSAEIVQRLIELGFVIVGKVKTTQFADSEWPTSDWVDYHAPFNPRGDGHLTTSGSSAGSAAAVASYPWLDFALGTDSLGSIRAPAAAQGIFGMRSSLGAASFQGIIPYSPKFDTVGGFARTAREFRVLAEALYGSHTQLQAVESKTPTKILYPTDYWPLRHNLSQDLFNATISRVENFLGMSRTEISLEKTWQRHRPSNITESLSGYMEHVFEWGANPDQWTGLFENFLPEYEERFGKPPVLNPQLRFKVDYLPTVTSEQQSEALRRLKVYQDWFYKHVMPPADESGHSSTVMVLPWTDGIPDYRDRYRHGPQKFTGIGFFFYNVGTYAEAPEIIIPAGTTPYVSKYTGRTERLPAALGIVGAKGSDVSLARLVSDIFDGTAVENPQQRSQKPLSPRL
ncbi:putative amidotransferase subunit A [Triangularia verruculosa]|uniref:Amidotransferase subunit A n=1 Tax=Triangularia verruculosa TaxID=2587418 RepID=A0AAN7AVX4_9PEZI|nr:putative amidotransferase subunit A [Triangularia verruculosa]